MLSATDILKLHDSLTAIWHDVPNQAGLSAPVPADDGRVENTWLGAVGRQHRANFELWHIEDEARTPNATDTELANVKRRIDRVNQLRNDLAEELDRVLLGWLESRGLPNPASPLNSESPGLIIDRLSILALKTFHTREEAERTGAPEGHAERNRGRLSILEEQRADLAASLDMLWQDTLNGTRRFKLYRQLKMYNDPFLNPAIYRKSTEAPSG